MIDIQQFSNKFDFPENLLVTNNKFIWCDKEIIWKLSIKLNENLLSSGAFFGEVRLDVMSRYMLDKRQIPWSLRHPFDFYKLHFSLVSTERHQQICEPGNCVLFFDAFLLIHLRTHNGLGIKFTSKNRKTVCDAESEAVTGQMFIFWWLLLYFIYVTYSNLIIFTTTLSSRFPLLQHLPYLYFVAFLNFIFLIHSFHVNRANWQDLDDWQVDAYFNIEIESLKIISSRTKCVLFFSDFTLMIME